MDFYISIPKTSNQIDDIETTGYYVFLTTLSNKSISYTLETASDTIEDGLLLSNSGKKIELDAALAVGSPSYNDRNLGLHLHASGPVSVLVVGYATNAIGEYSAIPYESLNMSEYVYFAVSTRSNKQGYNGTILLVANEDETNVTITPTVDVTVPVDPQTKNGTETLKPPNSKTMTMKQFQTILIVATSYSFDLSGSKIVSTKPLTVVSGHECGTIPQAVDYCETIMEQVPPAATLGTKFLLSPYQERGAQYYRIIASRDGVTNVKQNCLDKEIILDGAGGHSTFVTPVDTYCYLEANQPIFVTQMSPGSLKDKKAGDPAISVIPPMDRYIKGVSFYAPLFDDITEAYINIVAKEKATFYLDKVALSSSWIDIFDLNNKHIGYVLEIGTVQTDMEHNITCLDEVDFYALVYGFGDQKAYSFTPGLSEYIFCLNEYVCIYNYHLDD